MKTYLIALDDAAKRRAIAVAHTRNNASIAKGSRPNHGGPAQRTREALEKNILGCFGEFAVASFLGEPEPTTVNTYHEPDLAGRIQVRARDPRRGLAKCDHLIVRNDDSAGDRYVLVLLETPKLRIMGWIKGLAAKLEKYKFGYGNRPVQFFVPPADLNDASALRVDSGVMVDADEINW